MACGVYRIEHTGTGRAYIGRSGNVHARLEQHRADLNRGQHDNPKLQRAWSEHGADAFEFAVVELCDPENVERRERRHIEQYSDRPTGTFNRADSTGGMPSRDREATTVYLEGELKQRLKLYCAAEDREMSQFVNETIADNLEGWKP